MTVIHQTSVVIDNDGDFGVGLIDPPAVFGNFPDRRFSAVSEPAVPVQFQITLDIRFVHGQVFRQFPHTFCVPIEQHYLRVMSRHH